MIRKITTSAYGEAVRACFMLSLRSGSAYVAEHPAWGSVDEATPQCLDADVQKAAKSRRLTRSVCAGSLVG